jgi:hypothetical protein
MLAVRVDLLVHTGPKAEEHPRGWRPSRSSYSTRCTDCCRTTGMRPAAAAPSRLSWCVLGWADHRPKASGESWDLCFGLSLGESPSKLQ